MCCRRSATTRYRAYFVDRCAASRCARHGPSAAMENRSVQSVRLVVSRANGTGLCRMAELAARDAFQALAVRAEGDDAGFAHPSPLAPCLPCAALERRLCLAGQGAVALLSRMLSVAETLGGGVRTAAATCVRRVRGGAGARRRFAAQKQSDVDTRPTLSRLPTINSLDSVAVRSANRQQWHKADLAEALAATGATARAGGRLRRRTADRSARGAVCTRRAGRPGCRCTLQEVRLGPIYGLGVGR